MVLFEVRKEQLVVCIRYKQLNSGLNSPYKINIDHKVRNTLASDNDMMIFEYVKLEIDRLICLGSDIRVMHSVGDAITGLIYITCPPKTQPN